MISFRTPIIPPAPDTEEISDIYMVNLLTPFFHIYSKIQQKSSKNPIWNPLNNHIKTKKSRKSRLPIFVFNGSHVSAGSVEELEAMTLEAAELERQLEAAEASEMALLQVRDGRGKYTEKYV